MASRCAIERFGVNESDFVKDISELVHMLSGGYGFTPLDSFLLPDTDPAIATMIAAAAEKLRSKVAPSPASALEDTALLTTFVL